MKVQGIFVVFFFAYVAADAPPIPYAAAAIAPPAAFSNDHVPAVGGQYVEHFNPEGFNLQSGYEGYLIPAAEHGLLPFVDGLDFKGHGLISKVIRNLISIGSKVVPKILIGAAVLLGLFVIGGCVNALICTFTPFCTISFLGLGVTKETMRSYLTPDRISTTANFVMDAIKKYKDMYETASNEIDIGKKSGKK